MKETKKVRAGDMLAGLKEINMSDYNVVARSTSQQYDEIFDRVAKLHDGKAFVLEFETVKLAGSARAQLRSALNIRKETELYLMIQRGKCVYIKNND